MKVGEWVHSSMDGALGLITNVEARTGGADVFGEHVYRVFWLDEDEPAWYYEHEVESVDEAR